MFSIRSFTVAAVRASSATPSVVNSSVAPSASISAAYCLVSAFSGSVMMRTKSASVGGLSSTRIGKRPCSSGIRSEGLETWNAPAATNRTWSVFTMPYFVDVGSFDDRQQVALHPFSRDVGSAPLPALAGDLVDLVEEDDPHGLDALQRVGGDVLEVDQLLQLLLEQDATRLAHLHRALLLPLRKHVLQHLGEVLHPLGRALRDHHVEHVRPLLGHLDLHLAPLELPVDQELAELVARAPVALAGRVALGLCVTPPLAATTIRRWWGTDDAPTPQGGSSRGCRVRRAVLVGRRKSRRAADHRHSIREVFDRASRSVPPCRSRSDEIAHHPPDISADVTNLGTSTST